MLLVLTEKRYIGKLCPRHPEAGGLRRKSNWICIVCASNSSKTYRKSEQGKQYMSRYLPEYMAVNFRDRARHRAELLKSRTPSWADVSKIKEIYVEARRSGLTVDHIIPLQGELVSGLHVDNNLQLIPGAENSRKRNSFSVV